MQELLSEIQRKEKELKLIKSCRRKVHRQAAAFR